MIPAEVAALLDRLDVQVENGVTSVKTVAWIARDLRAALERAFGEREKNTPSRRCAISSSDTTGEGS